MLDPEPSSRIVAASLVMPDGSRSVPPAKTCQVPPVRVPEERLVGAIDDALIVPPFAVNVPLLVQMTGEIVRVLPLLMVTVPLLVQVLGAGYCGAMVRLAPLSVCITLVLVLWNVVAVLPIAIVPPATSGCSVP